MDPGFFQLPDPRQKLLRSRRAGKLQHLPAADHRERARSRLGIHAAFAAYQKAFGSVSDLLQSTNGRRRLDHRRTALRSRTTLRWRRTLLSRSRSAQHAKHWLSRNASLSHLRFRFSFLRFWLFEWQRPATFFRPHRSFAFAIEIHRRTILARNHRAKRR